MLILILRIPPRSESINIILLLPVLLLLLLLLLYIPLLYMNEVKTNSHLCRSDFLGGIDCNNKNKGYAVGCSCRC